MTTGEQKHSITTGDDDDDVYKSLRSLDTGDILLYRTTSLGATFNAAMQGSNYSHISMVVRGDRSKLRNMYPNDYKEDDEDNIENKDDLAILEAVPKRGVSLFPLEQRLIRSIDSILYLSVRRHLGIIPKSAHDSLDVFMKGVMGRKLETCTPDMARCLFFNRLRGKLKALGVENQNEHWDAFFCSELVAEALQQLFILREEGLCSNNFIPASFAEPKHPEKHKGNSFDMKERITMPGHSYGKQEILLMPGNNLHKELKARKKHMKEEYNTKESIEKGKNKGK